MKNTQSNNRLDQIELIVRAQQSDEESFEALLSDYAPLIESMTAQFSAPWHTVQDREDIRQEAVLGFYSALMHYDTTQKEVVFGYYAKECIRNRLISYLRSIKKHEKIFLLEDEGLADEVEDAEQDPATDLVQKETYAALYQRVCNTLSPYENRVWWMYLSGRTAEEIAKRVGRDTRSVQNAVYRIRKKLRAVIPYP